MPTKSLRALSFPLKSIFAPEVTLESIKQEAKGTFTETLGLEFIELGAECLKGRIVVDGRHLRPGNIMNGGVSLGLIEAVGSTAARCVLGAQPKVSLGIQVNANHFAAAGPSEELTITAAAVHLGRTTHVWEVAIENQKGRLISSGRITLLVVDA